VFFISLTVQLRNSNTTTTTAIGLRQPRTVRPGPIRLRALRGAFVPVECAEMTVCIAFALLWLAWGRDRVGFSSSSAAPRETRASRPSVAGQETVAAEFSDRRRHAPVADRNIFSPRESLRRGRPKLRTPSPPCTLFPYRPRRVRRSTTYAETHDITPRGATTAAVTHTPPADLRHSRVQYLRSKTRPAVPVFMGCTCACYECRVAQAYKVKGNYSNY